LLLKKPGAAFALGVKIAPLEKILKIRIEALKKIAEGSDKIERMESRVFGNEDRLIRSKKSPGSNHTASFLAKKENRRSF